MKVELRPEKRPWMLRAKFPYSPGLVKRLGSIPGCKWFPVEKEWAVPIEVAQDVFKLEPKQVGAIAWMPTSPLHPYQKSGVEGALAAPATRWFFTDEMGLGKTAQAIVASKLCDAKRILVVCPASVRRQWAREFDTWWPEHPRTGVIFAGTGRKYMSKKDRAELEEAMTAPIQMVSLSMLPRWVEEQGPGQWDVIIFDESHLLQKPKSSWSKAARKLTRNHTGPIFGLSATPMPNQPMDAWNVADIFCPGRFGDPTATGDINWKFRRRYTNASHNGYGWAFKGVNEAHQEELSNRLAAFSSRATRREWGHLLPKAIVRLYEAPEGTTMFKSATDWYKTAKEEGTHVILLTHLKRTAKDIAKKLGAVCITGEIPVDRRNELLEEAQKAPSACIVATMHSVGRSINLAWCGRVLFVELYWRPETIIQALGRFPRLGGTATPIIDLLSIRGDISERVAMVLADKSESIMSVIDAGQAEFDLVKAIRGNEEDVLTDLLSAISSGGSADDIDPLDSDVGDE
jgi:SNF2 family DNA or RNA helicase